MKIILQTSIVRGNTFYGVGDPVDLPDEEAQRFLDKDMATRCPFDEGLKRLAGSGQEPVTHDQTDHGDAEGKPAFDVTKPTRAPKARGSKPAAGGGSESK